MCITIKVPLHSEKLWFGHRIWVFVHCDIDVGDMSLSVLGYYTPLGHSQQLSEILSSSNWQ